jgi:hypothetical protein
VGAVGMATAGLKLPELKAELKRIVKQLDTEEGQLQRAMIMEESSESDSDETGGGGQKKHSRYRTTRTATASRKGTKSKTWGAR